MKNILEEQKIASEILRNQENAESVRKNDSTGEFGSVEQVWEDEYKIFNGNQWGTSFAYRSKEGRQRRPNSIDNFVFPAIMNMHAIITNSTPEVTIEQVGENDKDISQKLTYISRFNDKRNNFSALWKRMVLQYLSYGPIIGSVMWDSEWMGGKGPDRWVGDVRLMYIDRREIYFDPAIIDLEFRLQECSFVHRKYRKKLSYIKTRWDVEVSEEHNTNDITNEGSEPNQAYVIEAWHRGLPKIMPKKEVLRLQEKAFRDKDNDYYRYQKCLEQSRGTVEGIHLAYYSNGILLEYIPYVYDDGLYPFIYKTLYFDENTQHGFGEIRNVKVPQVLHNKADEIEIEAMTRTGLGGKYYMKNAVTPRQLNEIKQNAGKGGMWHEVDNLNGIADKETVSVPASITNYKEHKQRMVETISQNTPIQQGLSPGTHVPYKAIAELGARTDIRTKGKVEVLEDFLKEMNQLRINRFAQFYTQDRYYRIKGEGNKIVQGSFNSDEMFFEWSREEIADETGNIDVKKERFVPDFDVSVKIMDEKPTDRNYYTATAADLYKSNAMDIESLWYTLVEGKFPTKEEVLERLKNKDIGMQIAQTLNQLSPEQRDQLMGALPSVISQIAGTAQPST